MSNYIFMCQYNDLTRLRIESSKYYKNGKLTIDEDSLYLLPLFDFSSHSTPDDREKAIISEINTIIEKENLGVEDTIALVHAGDIEMDEGDWLPLPEKLKDSLKRIVAYNRASSDAYRWLTSPKEIDESYLKELKNKLKNEK